MSLTKKFTPFALILLAFGASTLFAQPYSAGFEVNSQIGCAPFTVVVTDLSGVPDTEPVNYDYGDGSDLDTLETHTYTNPGIYRIIQTVANANPRQDTVYVEVINHYPPEFMLLNCKGASASVIVRDTLYEAYEIDWGDGSTEIAPARTPVFHTYVVFNNYDVTVKGLINGLQGLADNSNINCSSTTRRLTMVTDLQAATIHEIRVLNTDPVNGQISIEYTLPSNNNYLIEIMDQNQTVFTIIDTLNRIINPNSYTISGLNTRDNFYCISVTSFDPCDGDVLQSNIGCSVLLQTTALNQQNRLDWQTDSNDFLNFTVEKEGNQLAIINISAQKQFLDNQVNCGITYDYQVIMREVSGLVSYSDQSNITAISTDIPDPVVNVSATVDDTDILLSWEQPAGFLAARYIIYKSTDGVNFSTLDTVTSMNYIDADLFTQSSRYYYRIGYQDDCANLSASGVVASPILLTPEYDQSLTWSQYVGWEAGVSGYLLEKYDENGSLVETVSLGLSGSYQEDFDSNPYQYLVYRIIAVPNDPLLDRVTSNWLTIIYPSKVAFPNAFSPNGDGINDIFNFESRYIRASNMKIYNRWGELIFQTSSPDTGWDGNINGKAAPPGAYIHYTEFTDDMGITFVKSGEIILIR